MKKSGITLLEMLVAMTLLASGIALLGSTLFQSDKFSKSVNAKLDFRKKVRNIKRIIQDDLSNSVYLGNLSQPVFRQKDKNSGIVGINGTSETNEKYDSIVFHVNKPSLFRPTLDITLDPELYEIGYFVIRKDLQSDVYQLVRREEYYVDSEFNFPERNMTMDVYVDNERSITKVLIPDIRSFQIRYLADYKNFDEGWVDEWDSGKKSNGSRIPYVVEISISLPDETTERILLDSVVSIFNDEEEEGLLKDDIRITLRSGMPSAIKWQY